MVIFRYWMVSHNWTDGFVEGECSGQGGSFLPSAGWPEVKEKIRFPIISEIPNKMREIYLDWSDSRGHKTKL